MAKVTDEEFAELEQERRHEELISAVANIRPSDTKRLESLLESNLATMTALLKKDSPAPVISSKLETILEKSLTKGIDLTPLIKVLSKEEKNEPRTFRVVRNQHGFIDKIVVEK